MLNEWRIKPNLNKWVQVTFTTRRDTCPTVTLNDIEISQSSSTKYLGIHLDRKLTLRDHIFAKRKQLGIQCRKIYWFINMQSPLFLENKLLLYLYYCIIKPIWTYGIQLWGTASNSNIETLQRFQSKTLRIIANASRFITNIHLHRDLNIPLVKDEIRTTTEKYQDRIHRHPNVLASTLMSSSSKFTRLRRVAPIDLII